jgi:hypothetical protein
MLDEVLAACKLSYACQVLYCDILTNMRGEQGVAHILCGPSTTMSEGVCVCDFLGLCSICVIKSCCRQVRISMPSPISRHYPQL